MLMRRIMATMVGLMALAQVAFAADKLALEQVDSVVLPGDEIELRLGFDGEAPEPVPY